MLSLLGRCKANIFFSYSLKCNQREEGRRGYELIGDLIGELERRADILVVISEMDCKLVKKIERGKCFFPRHTRSMPNQLNLKKSIWGKCVQMRKTKFCPLTTSPHVQLTGFSIIFPAQLQTYRLNKPTLFIPKELLPNTNTHPCWLAMWRGRRGMRMQPLPLPLCSCHCTTLKIIVSETDSFFYLPEIW